MPHFGFQNTFKDHEAGNVRRLPTGSACKPPVLLVYGDVSCRVGGRMAGLGRDAEDWVAFLVPVKDATSWGYPDLDRAQFASDKHYERYEKITERVGAIVSSKNAGTATAEELSEIEGLKEELITLIGEIGQIGERLLAGDKAPHLKVVK